MFQLVIWLLHIIVPANNVDMLGIWDAVGVKRQFFSKYRRRRTDASPNSWLMGMGIEMH